MATLNGLISLGSKKAIDAANIKAGTIYLCTDGGIYFDKSDSERILLAMVTYTKEEIDNLIKNISADNVKYENENLQDVSTVNGALDAIVSKIYSNTGKSQYDTMPDATSLTGIVQYVGETNDTYTQGYFYLSDGTAWTQINVQPDIIKTSDDIVCNVSIGGYVSGETIPAGTTYQDIFNKLFVKYFAPEVNLSINHSTRVYAVGSTVESLELTANTTKNSNPITSVTFKKDGVSLNTITEDADPTVVDSGTFTYILSETITTDTTVSVEVTDDKETDIDSITIQFVNPIYYGVSDTNNVSNTTNLTELVELPGSKSVSITASNQYIVYMTTSTLTSILDKNGFENIDSFVKSTIDLNGVSYNRYVTETTVTCSDFDYRFIV